MRRVVLQTISQVAGSSFDKHDSLDHGTAINWSSFDTVSISIDLHSIPQSEHCIIFRSPSVNAILLCFINIETILLVCNIKAYEIIIEFENKNTYKKNYRIFVTKYAAKFCKNHVRKIINFWKSRKFQEKIVKVQQLDYNQIYI